MGEDRASRRVKSLRPRQSVLPYARQHHRENKISVDLIHGVEQYIDGRPARILRRALVEFDVNGRQQVRECHVIVAVRNPGAARPEALTVARLVDGQLGLTRQLLNQVLRENSRHVLDDHDGYGQIRRKTGEQVGERVGPSC